MFYTHSIIQLYDRIPSFPMPGISTAYLAEVCLPRIEILPSEISKYQSVRSQDMTKTIFHETNEADKNNIVGMADELDSKTNTRQIPVVYTRTLEVVSNQAFILVQCS